MKNLASDGAHKDMLTMKPSLTLTKPPFNFNSPFLIKRRDKHHIVKIRAEQKTNLKFVIIHNDLIQTTLNTNILTSPSCALATER